MAATLVLEHLTSMQHVGGVRGKILGVDFLQTHLFSPESLHHEAGPERGWGGVGQATTLNPKPQH